MKSGKLIVIVAPSGTGKSTLIKEIRNGFPELEESVSHTTRPIRPGEIDGKNYYFVSPDEFMAIKKDDGFIEWAEVHGNYYGTSKAFVDKHLAANEFVLFDLDVQGCDAIKKIYRQKASIIFISPPSVEELEKRLRDRGTESEESIKTRLNNAKSELTRANDYDYLVYNDDYNRCLNELKTVISGILKG